MARWMCVLDVLTGVPMLVLVALLCPLLAFHQVVCGWDVTAVWSQYAFLWFDGWVHFEKLVAVLVREHVECRQCPAGRGF